MPALGREPSLLGRPLGDVQPHAAQYTSHKDAARRRMFFFSSVFLPSSRLLGLSLIKSGSYASQPHLTRPGLPVLKARKSELKSGDHDIELRCYSPTNSWTRERNDVPTLFKYYNIGPVSLLRIHFTSRTY